MNVWERLNRVVLILLFVVGAVVVFIWYLPLIQQNQRYRKEIFSLETKIQNEERQGRQLKGAIDAVQNDPKTLERLAREKLGWAKTNETVVRFESPRAR
jgi:cell division protein FtsB